MSAEMTIRAWKDAEYRQSLSPEVLAQLQENPAGCMQLTDAELVATDGGWTPTPAVIAASFRFCLPIAKWSYRSCHRINPPF